MDELQLKKYELEIRAKREQRLREREDRLKLQLEYKLNKCKNCKIN